MLSVQLIKSIENIFLSFFLLTIAPENNKGVKL